MNDNNVQEEESIDSTNPPWQEWHDTIGTGPKGSAVAYLDVGYPIGLYDVNVVAHRPTGYSLFPPEATKVFIDADRDPEYRRSGYFDVTFFDDEGKVVARNNRAAHRIAAALEGEEGYDIAVSRRSA